VLLGVVVDELFDAGLNPADLGEDLVGGGGPDERFRIGVPVLDVGADAVDQGVDRGERAAADGLFGDDAEPGLDLVDPRGADRVKWNVIFGFASLVDQAQVERPLTRASVARRSSSEQAQGRRAAASGGSVSVVGPW
jgi:hypothetical protein